MYANPLAALKAAVSYAGVTSLAKAAGVSPPTIYTWYRSGRIPAERVLAVEKATGISRHELRPDIYPVEDHHQAARHDPRSRC